MSLTIPAIATENREPIDSAVQSLDRAVHEGQVAAAALHVVQRDQAVTRAFGTAKEDSMFLLGSISKPICLTALMTLFDGGAFKLSDPIQKFLPKFKGDRRGEVTIQHLLTHVSGLPDQLPENNQLRAAHASLHEFADHALRAPLSFAPGSKYQYSSMGVLLATRVAEIISGSDIVSLVGERVFKPLKMQRSAQGLGRFKLADMIPVQIEHAAPEAGGGDPTAKTWDWNSAYWRSLGAPWGGTHCCAADLAKFLGELLHPTGACVKPDTARLMITNHNPAGFPPRGLGLALGSSLGTKIISEAAFGHTGSTGTIAWADPKTQTTCVVLTSLPAQAVHPHPRDLAADAIAIAAA